MLFFYLRLFIKLLYISRNGTYFSVIEKLKKTEQVKLLALQAKERIVRLLEKSVELGRESILFKAAETRDKTALAELKT